MLQKKYRVLGVAIIITLGFVFIIGDQGLKPNVARLRPFVDFPNVTVPLESALPKATSYSFPSGHSFGSFASSMTIYLGLTQIAPQKRY
ncbi:PAP2 family protein, partial [human gut metagenome]